ncbi:GrpE protein [Seinonella peptonophila]|uniref:GrpE protein n=1 Tax=Seinonella peptonophila TaxID=112248 RepID=A0A1M4YT42_9BACL|nr:nucleotide exchange factor GrpE [Seinonella peptonophila]SHF08898.1 GrpE protein [Seinonella peptonophila]
MVFKRERYDSSKKAPQVPSSSDPELSITGKKQMIPQKMDRQQAPLKPIDRSQQQLFSFLSNLQTNFASLVHLFERRLSYDKTKEMAFDRLYQEMEELKQEQTFNELRPLYIDLILLIDRMEQIEFDLEENGAASPEVENIMVTLKNEVLEILYRRGVEQIEHTPEYFDPTFQKVVDTEPTYNPSEDNLVVGIRRDGYRFQDMVLRPEEVVIKKFQG